jgi:hypothetical protein
MSDMHALPPRFARRSGDASIAQAPRWARITDHHPREYGRYQKYESQEFSDDGANGLPLDIVYPGFPAMARLTAAGRLKRERPDSDVAATPSTIELSLWGRC